MAFVVVVSPSGKYAKESDRRGEEFAFKQEKESGLDKDMCRETKTMSIVLQQRSIGPGLVTHILAYRLSDDHMREAPRKTPSYLGHVLVAWGLLLSFSHLSTTRGRVVVVVGPF